MTNIYKMTCSCDHHRLTKACMGNIFGRMAALAQIWRLQGQTELLKSWKVCVCNQFWGVISHERVSLQLHHKNLPILQVSFSETASLVKLHQISKSLRWL